LGIGSYLLEILEGIARKNGYNQFVATVLAENRKMIRVFQKRYPNSKVNHTGGGEVEVIMDFEPLPEKSSE
ncbi:MAG: GNAT family N-acetyltransferase, partial [Desulfamplus sp.]|nr:GNAT family N-acetyltransferase [Desulfamplus sp.]